MSKETRARESNRCPTCLGQFTFLEYHIPHCQGVHVRRPVAGEAAVAIINAPAATKLVPELVAISSAVAANTAQGAVKDEKLRTKKRGSTAKAARPKGERA